MKYVLTDPDLDEIVVILKSYDPERIILFGSRARGEADEYSDYDLIVMGTRGRGAVSHLIEPSLAEHVVRRATVPVLTIHAPSPGTARVDLPPQEVVAMP